MELSKNFDHTTAEKNWYRHWLVKGYFTSIPDEREPYTIVIPPPNVTGVLHMGHCLNNTIQDILIRHARMNGKNACWVPGTDHASIATEAKVVGMLRERGITKSSLSREDFLKYAWEWKEKYGGIILDQLHKLGCSLDWNRTSFTMDDDYYSSVIAVFNDLYNKGHIYRGKRMINWDVKAKTALSDEEVIRRETKQKLYYLQYKIDGSEDNIIIATVRPETIMGDTAICVHPGDERYKHLHGKFALVPLINRLIPIITDEYVTMDFGTGALKVTPAHDMNDYQLGQKHNLEIIDILNDDGTLNEDAQILAGEDRFEARKKIVTELAEKEYLLKTEDYTSEVGYSERTDTIVEPRLSLQWWVSMKEISKPALHAVINEDIHFHPEKFRNSFRYWMENIKDWCISRQLWWGHRIPAWYDGEGNYVVAINQEEAIKKYKEKYSQLSTVNCQLHQDEDCLDTWFSSWLWPFEVFKGYSNPGNADVKYYYPTNTLVTAPEIIFFWVARMIMAGFEYQKEKPFSDVYFTGIVRDKLGRKMSKSLGNSPDLLKMIEDNGADAVRFGVMISSPAGNDLMWDQAGNDQGKFFINKMWNALKLVKMWEGRKVEHLSPALSGGEGGSRLTDESSKEENFAILWFENRLNEVKAEIEKLYKQFRLSEALKTIYSLVWDDFCSWYLEWVKPGFEQPIETAVYNKTVFFFEELMQLLHPFMPFVTEEIYHRIIEREDDLCVKQTLPLSPIHNSILKNGERLKNDITSLREIRAKHQLKNTEKFEYFGDSSTQAFYNMNPNLSSILQRQTGSLNTDSAEFTAMKKEGGIEEMINNEILVVSSESKFYVHLDKKVDMKLQNEELLKDLQYQKDFLQSVLKKLSNEKFVAHAKPDVIALERKKQSDAEARIKTIEESLAGM